MHTLTRKVKKRIGETVLKVLERKELVMLSLKSTNLRSMLKTGDHTIWLSGILMRKERFPLLVSSSCFINSVKELVSLSTAVSLKVITQFKLMNKPGKERVILTPL